MSDADTLGVLTVVLCLLGSMFFSGSETAVTSLDERRARRMVEEGGFRGRVMRAWVEEPVRVLSTILIGNNVVNTLMGAVVTALAIRHFGDGPNADYAVAIAVFVTTALLLVFGEITPKAIGRVFAEKVAVPALWFISVLSRLIAPVLWLLSRLTNVLINRLVTSSGTSMINRVTADEIGYLVDVGHREGSIRAGQAALIQGIIRFEDKIVRDIMVPGDRVTAVNRAWEVKRIREVAMRSGHSRMPVFEGDINNVVGVLHIKQLVGLPEKGTVERVMRPPVFISESLRLHDLLQRFKEQRVHLAIVVDDAGDTAGVVTLEDVLEQIVGQIFDETDRAPPSQPQDQPGFGHFDGQDTLTMVEERLGVEIEEEIEGVVSIGDLLTYLAGQIPIAGSVFVWEGLRFKVLAADARHVIKVSAEQVEADDDDDD
ncbi:MAG: HlyC/CorC family transporter [Myxococcales bacterium]|nr:HlyC/CorC family transporter [Myxococcales bacterium]